MDIATDMYEDLKFKLGSLEPRAVIIFILQAAAIYWLAPLPFWLFFEVLRRKYAKRVTVETRIDTAVPSKDEIHTLPEKLRQNPQDYVLSIEHASKLVATSAMPPGVSKSEILTRFMRGNMRSFRRLPHATLLKWMYKSPEAKRTFDHEHLANLDFEVGDIACGGYRVAVREEGRVEIEAVPPKMLEKPWFDGGVALVIRVEERAEGMVFMNGEFRALHYCPFMIRA